jgi:decaprenylphospho-beta-D-ribofuranose 2-oxidase
VHGKSQAHSGNFMRWVKRLHVVHPDHGERICEPGDENRLFELTGGGFGLTGFVTRARLQLVPLAGESLVRESVPVSNLDESLECMEHRSPGAHAVYSWNDLTRKGSSFGRGVVYVERFSDVPLPRACRFRELTPQQARLPGAALNRLTTPVVNRLYGAVERVRAPRVRLPIEGGSFPINGKEFFYAMFGRRGFREYQALVPRESWDDFSREVRRLVRRHRMAPALGSMKLFTGERSRLNFAGEGVCLAIDVPASERALDFLSDLDTIVIEASGVVNISKDSRLSKNTVAAIFDGYGEFVKAIRLADPAGRMASSLRRRLID